MSHRFCAQSEVLRQTLHDAYTSLEELKFLEASPDGLRYVEYEIVALHESITMHEPDCKICGVTSAVPGVIDIPWPSNSSLELFPISFRQARTRATLVM